jgi:uncharacterized protein (DUF2141 family)
VSEVKKSLSTKVLAFMLALACVVTFMPVLASPAYAATAKKPAKVTVKSAKQVSGTLKAKVTWKKAKNAKKYNVKIDGKVVKKNYKKVTYKSKALAAGSHKVQVQGVNGKKKGKWSAAKSFSIAVPVKSVTIDNMSPRVDDVITAVVTPADATGAKYQWYRTGDSSGGDNPIAGATEASYKVVAADRGMPLYCAVTAGGKTVKSAETAAVEVNDDVTYVAAIQTKANAATSDPADFTNVVTPVVGEKVYANLWGMYDSESYAKTQKQGGEAVVSGLTYQWYADGAKISGATASSYTVPELKSGAKLSCVVTYKKVDYATQETEAVAADKTADAVVITGMAAEAPVVGETLKANLVYGTEKAAADVPEDVTYQWYRGSVEINGATAAEYTVTANDSGSVLRVVVKSEKYTTSGLDKSTAAVADALTGVELKLEPKAAVVGTDVKVTPAKAAGATKDADTTNWTYEWYIDSVADENKLYSAAYEVGKDQTAWSGDTLKPVYEGGFYLAGQTAKTDLVGHKLVVVGTTKVGNTNGQGVLTSNLTDAVTYPVEAATITNDSGVVTGGKTNVIAGKSTLTVEATSGEDAADAEVTATYQWASSADGNTFTDIEGATGASYEIPNDQAAGTVYYKVTVKGNGNYSGKQEAEVEATVSANTATSSVELVVDDATPQAGQELTASSKPAKAGSYLTYKWKYTPNGGTATETTGAKFTVPETATGSDGLVLSATSSVSDYSNPTVVTISIQNKISNAKLTSSADKAATTQTAAYDGVATPSVGETLTMTATAGESAEYQWYSGDDKIDGATTSAYTIQASDLGKVVSCEVKGGTGYDGSSVKLQTGAAVKSAGTITVTGDKHKDPLGTVSAGEVGEKLTASVAGAFYNAGSIADDKADISSEMTYTWYVDGKVVAADADDKTGATFTIPDTAQGMTIAVVASNDYVTESKAGSLTWDNGLLIEGAESAERYVVDFTLSGSNNFSYSTNGSRFATITNAKDQYGDSITVAPANVKVDKVVANVRSGREFAGTAQSYGNGSAVYLTATGSGNVNSGDTITVTVTAGKATKSITATRTGSGYNARWNFEE